MDASTAMPVSGWQLRLEYLGHALSAAELVLAAAAVFVAVSLLEASLAPSSPRPRGGGLRTRLALAWPLIPLALVALGASLLFGVALAWSTLWLVQQFAGKPGGAWPLALAGALLLGLFAGLARVLNPRHLKLVLVLAVVSVVGALAPALKLPATVSASAALQLAAFSLACAWVYRFLNAINSRYTPRSLLVTQVLEGPNRRQDLERLLEEGFYKSSLHSPSPVPGGEPLYWTHFKEDVQRLAAEADGATRLGAVLKSVGTFLRVASVPHRLEVEGALIGEPHDARRGVRIRAVDANSGELVLADTFWGKSEHAAVELASYAVAAAAFYRCHYLPGWVLWEGRDGGAVRSYWRGCAALRSLRNRGAERALEWFERSYAQSPGTAYPCFQLAGMYELKGIRAAVGWDPETRERKPERADLPEARSQLVLSMELYCSLLAKHPHLLLGWFRLSAVLSNVDCWLSGTDAERRATWSRVYHALDALDGRGVPRLQLARWAGPPSERLALETSREILTWLEGAIRWRVLWWSAKSLAERRWFGLTVFHPPSERLALQRAPAAARLGVEVQLLRACIQRGDKDECACKAVAARLVGVVVPRGARLHPPDAQELLYALRQCEQSLPREFRRVSKWLFCGEHAQHCTAFLELLLRAEALEDEARRLGGDKGGWWGAVQYALACFHSQVLALSREARVVSGVAHEPARAPMAEDYWAARAVNLLRRSGRDVKGALGEDRRRWFEVDPDLEPVRNHPRFTDWKGAEQPVVPPRKPPPRGDGKTPPGAAVEPPAVLEPALAAQANAAPPPDEPRA